MNAINAASFIADGLTAMNRAAAPEPRAYASRSVIDTMARTEYRLRLHAQVVIDCGADGGEFLEWADELHTAINEAKGLRP